MIIPVSLMFIFLIFLAVNLSLRSFDDLVRISGTVNRIDSVDVKKNRRSLFGSCYYRRYYLDLDEGSYKTAKKVVRSIHPGDHVNIYIRSANEPFSGLIPDDDIILHLEHNDHILIDYNEDQKMWYGFTVMIILFAGFMVHMMRKRLREDRLADGS